MASNRAPPAIDVVVSPRIRSAHYNPDQSVSAFSFRPRFASVELIPPATAPAGCLPGGAVAWGHGGGRGAVSPIASRAARVTTGNQLKGCGVRLQCAACGSRWTGRGRTVNDFLAVHSFLPHPRAPGCGSLFPSTSFGHPAWQELQPNPQAAPVAMLKRR